MLINSESIKKSGNINTYMFEQTTNEDAKSLSCGQGESAENSLSKLHAPDTVHSQPDTDILVEQLVDGIAGKETDNPSENDIEMRRRLSGRAWEYLMFMDDE